MGSFRVVSLVSVLALATLLTASAAGEKLQVKFVPASTYSSGAPGAASVAVADLRGVAKLDLVVANYCQALGQDSCQGYGQAAVLLGNGDGTFQPAVSYSTGAYGAESVAIGDVNADGVSDLVVASFCDTCQSGLVSVLLGNGDGTFQAAVTYSSGAPYAYSVALRDLRGKGKVDIVVSNAYTDHNYDGSVGVLLGNGDGTFQPAVSYDTAGKLAASVAIGDENGDGIPDLVVADYTEEDSGYYGGVAVLLGNGDGTFQPAVVYKSGGEFAVSVALADLRGDGILDAVIANRRSDNEGNRLRGEVSVLSGNGDGTFLAAVSYLADGVGYPSYPAIGSGVNSLVIADVNGDGIPDLAVVEWCQNLRHYTECVGNKEVNVFLGNGDGTFQAPVVYSSGGFIGSGLAIADVNGDGRPDLIVTNANVSEQNGNEGSVAVLLNETSYKTKTTLSASPNPAHVNQPVTLTATIASTPPVHDGEVVTFFNGKTSLGAGPTRNGVASLTTSFSKAKSYTIKADYPGDAFRKKSSGTVKLVVNP